MDTSVYTHFCRAGHANIIEKLAPGGVVLVPDEVNQEIERGRATYPDIPDVASVGWAEIAVLSDDEVWTQLQVKAQMSGGPNQHLGECAVIACAKHRNMAAILDERAAVAQADRFGVPTYDTLWIVIEAYKNLYHRDRASTARVVDDLLGTDMFLPVDLGESLLSWAYESGLLP
ncbi:hypothetical protein PWG71_15765 [Nocardiopsis sp. N85]|uniref:hypothetical protein n=1 Tax=Nocardiopsis sp. N85 TaxID=3029400 RepID=UPI00237F3D58|nr:hypothetical protein [Nocardiopsis sp. N85]MDE3722846.1 hypothetical protein [Nocardiopsis sp. N85]